MITMAAKPVPEVEMERSLRVLNECGGNVAEAARRLGVNRSTLQHRVERVRVTAPEKVVVAHDAQTKIRELEAALAAQTRDALDEHYIKTKILSLVDQEPSIPGWLLKDKPAKGSPGVPTLFLSDLHWGEVVDAGQIGGVNEYNLEIARRRLRRVVESATDLLFNHMVNPKYSGAVLALGGDMITGDIHEELSATNEQEVMPVVLDLWGSLVWVIETLADRFGRLFVPAVTGNHGRNTQKLRSKGRNFTSFDWLVYQFLAKRFENDKRVTIFAPDGPDALYSVNGHRYLLTHGDQFRGGDGMIGALGPIVRGDHRKRSRNGQIGMSYDTIVMAHWHQLMQTQRFIVNGSLIGYNEYAYNGNFPYEPPRQALWITHPGRGITFHMPVNADDYVKAEAPEWVMWTE